MTQANTSAVVTGASTGIGRAIAVELARQEMHVALLGRSTTGLKETAQKIVESGGEASIHPLDLRMVEEIPNLASQIIDSVPNLRVIVNVAGVWHDDSRAFQGPLVYETPTSESLEVLTVGLTAPFILTASLLPPLIQARTGHVINISGTFSDGAKGWLHYYTSKKAIEAFTIGLAQELRDFEIQVNCICPADVATEAYIQFYPDFASSAVKPEEIAEVACQLLAPPFRHVTGQIMEVRNRNDHD